jgi:hypothetical protein
MKTLSRWCIARRWWVVAAWVAGGGMSRVPGCASWTGCAQADQRTSTRAAAAMRSLSLSHNGGCCLPFTVMS